MGQPLVSVLIPVYQVEDYIERCDRSVFEQTYQKLECVFVDDGSTDSSNNILYTIINEYPSLKNRISIIHHLENRGLAAARNTAITSCHGDFVMHIDSDDKLELYAAELQHKPFDETRFTMILHLC